MDVDTRDRELVYRRTFAAPRILVFESLTDPEHLRRWWSPRENIMTVCEVDLRPGGVYRLAQRGPDGAESLSTGAYREIVPPERLVLTQVYDVGPSSSHEVLVTSTLEERGADTQLTRRLLFESVADRVAMLDTGLIEDMAESLDRLADLLVQTRRMGAARAA